MRFETIVSFVADTDSDELSCEIIDVENTDAALDSDDDELRTKQIIVKLLARTAKKHIDDRVAKDGLDAIIETELKDLLEAAQAVREE